MITNSTAVVLLNVLYSFVKIEVDQI